VNNFLLCGVDDTHQSFRAKCQPGFDEDGAATFWCPET